VLADSVLKTEMALSLPQAVMPGSLLVRHTCRQLAYIADLTEHNGAVAEGRPNHGEASATQCIDHLLQRGSGKGNTLANGG
jgi:hypothetical protein